jgi:hypothetical protein
LRLKEEVERDLSRSEIIEICNKYSLIFDDFETTFMELGKTFSAVTKKLCYKYGHLFYEDCEFQFQASLPFIDNFVSVEFSLGYFGEDYPPMVEVEENQKFKLLWSFHSVFDFATEAYIKFFESVLTDDVQDFCCGKFDYASDGSHEDHITSKYILGLLSIFFECQQAWLYRLTPKKHLGALVTS